MPGYLTGAGQAALVGQAADWLTDCLTDCLTELAGLAWLSWPGLTCLAGGASTLNNIYYYKIITLMII